jgi:hypothetical protein
MKKSVLSATLVAFVMMFVVMGLHALAQEAGAPVVEPSIWDKIGDILSGALVFIEDKKGVIGIVGGVLFALAKAVSTAKAPKVVALLQKIFDGLAKLFELAGKLCAVVGKVLAEIIKSDGVLGKL